MQTVNAHQHKKFTNNHHPKVILLYNGFGFSVGCHKRLHIGITVLFQNVGQFIQPFGDFLFRLLYLLGKKYSTDTDNALFAPIVLALSLLQKYV